MGPWVHRAQRLLGHVPSLALLAAFAALFGPSFLEHLENGFNRLRYHDDARIQIWPYYRYLEPEAWRDDYLGDYALSLIPIGHRALFAIAGRFVPADTFGKIVGYACLLFSLAVVAMLARKLAHRPAAFVAAAVMVGSSVPMERVVSGLPRAFAFPVMAMALYFTLGGRVVALAVTVVVGALFYPVVGLTAGAILAALLVLVPDVDRGQARGWSLPKRVAVLALTVLASTAALAPTIVGTRQYGSRVVDSEHDVYPEAGVLGTHGSEDRIPYPGLLEELQTSLSRTYVGEGDQIWRAFRERVFRWEKVTADAALVLALLGLAFAARRREEVRRLLPYLGGAAIAHVVARFGAPYFYAPSRYVLYAVIPALAVMLPVGIDALFRGPDDRPARPWLPRLLGVALCAVILGAIGGRGSTTRGLTIHVNADDHQLYQAIGALPPSAMIAGWPDDPMSNVPYLSRRKVLMTGEMHIAYHRGYLDEIRRRLTLFFEAYFASSTGPIFALRDQLGVTHVLVELRHLQGSPPGYMPPLGDRARAIAEANRARGYELLRQLETAAVARNQRFVLIEIAKLQPTPDH